MLINDNDPDTRTLLAHASDDPHGQAALILVESLIHGLVERSVLTTTDAIDVIEAATDVQADVAEAADGAGAKMWQSHSLLAMMAKSLEHDLRGSDERPRAQGSIRDTGSSRAALPD